MKATILDSWAVMAWLKGEQPAAGRVRQLLENAAGPEHRLAMSIANLGEVFYLCAKARDIAYAEHVLEHLRSRVSTVSLTDDLVLDAARLKAKHPISYADAFAAATALSEDAPLLTGDPELQALATREAGLQLEWIGA